MSDANQRVNDRRGLFRAAGRAIVDAITAADEAAAAEPEAPEAAEPKLEARRVNVAPRAVPPVRE